MRNQISVLNESACSFQNAVSFPSRKVNLRLVNCVAEIEMKVYVRPVRLLRLSGKVRCQLGPFNATSVELALPFSITSPRIALTHFLHHLVYTYISSFSFSFPFSYLVARKTNRQISK